MLTSPWPEHTVDDPQHIQDDPYYIGPRVGAVFSNQHTGYMGKKAYKICVDCELQKRLAYVNTKEYKEGDEPKEELMKEYATRVGVTKDLKAEVKGSNWSTQCVYLCEAKRRMVTLETSEAKDEKEDEEMPDAWKNLNFSVMTSRQKFRVRQQYACSALLAGGNGNLCRRSGQRHGRRHKRARPASPVATVTSAAGMGGGTGADTSVLGRLTSKKYKKKVRGKRDAEKRRDSREY